MPFGNADTGVSFSEANPQPTTKVDQQDLVHGSCGAFGDSKVPHGRMQSAETLKKLHGSETHTWPTWPVNKARAAQESENICPERGEPLKTRMVSTLKFSHDGRRVSNRYMSCNYPQRITGCLGSLGSRKAARWDWKNLPKERGLVY